jgi:hypothetical protein
MKYYFKTLFGLFLISSIITIPLHMISCTKEVTKIQTIEVPVKETVVVYDTLTKIEVVDCEPTPVNVTIYFSFDSYELSPEAMRILDGVKNLTTGPLQVIGYACPIGPEGYNHVLAMKRAKTKGEIHDCSEYIYCRKVVISGQ